MKIILIFLAFIMLPASIGWAAFEIGRGVGKVKIEERIEYRTRECPIAKETIPPLPNLLKDQQTKAAQTRAANCEWNLIIAKKTLAKQSADQELAECYELIKIKDAAMLSIMKQNSL